MSAGERELPELDEAVSLLADAGRVVVSTGAGMSRESGIPTFRDALDGLWARHSAEALATEAGFRADPRLVWGWYAERRRRILECEPHAGHRAVAELERLLPGMELVTQNVDGLHARAGSSDPVELHGSIHSFSCLDARHPYPGAVSTALQDPPPCPRCGSPLRPDVIWFGEPLPSGAIGRAWNAASACDVLLVVGTSGMVHPAAELPGVAQRAGASVIEINPEPGRITPIADLFLRGMAGVILPALLERLVAARPVR